MAISVELDLALVSNLLERKLRVHKMHLLRVCHGILWKGLGPLQSLFGTPTSCSCQKVIAEWLKYCIILIDACFN